MPGVEIDYDAIEGRKDDCYPQFFMRGVEDQEASKKVGHAIFTDVPYVKILIPGNDREIPVFRVTDTHKKRWPKQWEAFVQGAEQVVDGFQLEHWPRMTDALVKTLKAAHIHTLEQLVEAADDNLQRLGPQFFNLKYEARDFLDRDGASQAKIQKLEERNETLQARLDALEAKIMAEDKPAEGDQEGAIAAIAREAKSSGRRKPRKKE